MKHRTLIILAMAFVLQWGVIGHALWDHDRTLTTGSVHRFQVQPIDPRDPFRGEYVILDLAAENVQDADTSALFGANDPVYGTLGMDSSGYAIITALSKEAPEGDHVECRPHPRYGAAPCHLYASRPGCHLGKTP